MKKLLCINSKFEMPQFNLATEEYLLKNSPYDVFMLYVNSPSIIVGKHQNTLSEINLDFVEKNNLHVVRRLSGGGTVFHDLGNLNYAWIMHGKQGKLIDFNKYTDDILAYLQSIPVEATRNKNNDLLIDGKKISGNAEHVLKNKLIHHGTLLFASELNKLNSAINSDLSKFEDKSVSSKRSMVTNIVHHLKKDMTMDEFRNGLFQYVINKHENVEQYELTGHDLNEIKTNYREKYRSWEWNFGYSPKFLFSKELQINNKSTSIKLNINKGLIKDIELSGNLLTNEEITIFKKYLIGLQHRKSVIRNCIEEEDFSSILTKLSENDIMSLFF